MTISYRAYPEEIAFILTEFLKAAEVQDAELHKFHDNFFNLEDKIFDKLSAI